MSTKDLRFILPVFPSLCIFSGLFITGLRKYNWFKFYKILIFTVILLKIIIHINIHQSVTIKNDKTLKNIWPHKEIIEIVRNFSPYTKSVIAMIPDTKELNTFNLEAEANLQNSNVYIRQIISNELSYKDDLDRFNWFLIKDGDQGTMSNKAKLALSDLLQESNKFSNLKTWSLPDGSQAKL